MQVYRITDTPADSGTVLFHGTLADAHAEAKELGKVRRYVVPELRIELIDVATDKVGVLRLLNGASEYTPAALRTWALTDRLGLREVPNGE